MDTVTHESGLSGTPGSRWILTSVCLAPYYLINEVEAKNLGLEKASWTTMLFLPRRH